MCCTFNMAAADELFAQGQYQKMITKMQTRDANMSFVKGKLPKKLTDMPNGGMNPEAGMKKGLSLVLDAHTDIIKVTELYRCRNEVK